MRLKMLIGLFLLMPGSFILTGTLINAVAAATGFNGLILMGLMLVAGVVILLRVK